MFGLPIPNPFANLVSPFRAFVVGVVLGGLGTAALLLW